MHRRTRYLPQKHNRKTPGSCAAACPRTLVLTERCIILIVTSEMSAYVKQFYNMVNTYPPTTLCTMLQQLCKGLSGQCRSDDFQFSYTAEKVEGIQSRRAGGSWPVSTVYEVHELWSPLLLACLACKQWLVHVITPLGYKKTNPRIPELLETISWHTLRHLGYILSRITPA